MHTEVYTLVDLVKLVRKGISFKGFSEIQDEINLTTEDWCRILDISIRTFKQYKKDNITFDRLRTEKIYELSLTYKKGASTFCSEEKFSKWLDRENLNFDNQKPKDFLDTSFGIEMIKRELHKIELFT